MKKEKPNFEHVERVEPGTLSFEMYGGDHLQRYKFFEPYYKNKKVLDAACGAGYGSQIILDFGAQEVVGIDIDKKIILKNKHLYPSVCFYELNCLDIDKLNKQFDTIVSFETIEHLDDIDTFFQKVDSVLSDNGYFICSTPNVNRFSKYLPNTNNKNNPYHIHELTFDEFVQLTGKYFHIEKIYHQSETVEFMRYLKLASDLHQLRREFESSISMRIENFFRKLIGSPFQPIPFFFHKCDFHFEKDFYIEEVTTPENWHKTYIILAKKLNK